MSSPSRKNFRREFQNSLPNSSRAGGHTIYRHIWDYVLWFNHVIKTEKGKMINSEHLWRFITRDTRIMCNIGCPYVLPACVRTETLSCGTVIAKVMAAIVNLPSRRGRDKIMKMTSDSKKMCEREDVRRNTYSRQRFYERGHPRKRIKEERYARGLRFHGKAH